MKIIKDTVNNAFEKFEKQKIEEIQVLKLSQSMVMKIKNKISI